MTFLIINWIPCDYLGVFFFIDFQIELILYCSFMMIFEMLRDSFKACKHFSILEVDFQSHFCCFCVKLQVLDFCHATFGQFNTCPYGQLAGHFLHDIKYQLPFSCLIYIVTVDKLKYRYQIGREPGDSVNRCAIICLPLFAEKYFC